MSHATKVAMVNAGLFIVAALALLVAPVPLLARLSIPSRSFGVLALSRVLAAVLLVLGAIFWGARHWLASPQAVETLRLVSVAYAIAALLALTQQAAIWYGRFSLSLCFMLVIFALEYGLMAWRGPSARSAARAA
jgi:hypothetical protein